MDRRIFIIGTVASATTIAAGPAFAQGAFPTHAITIMNEKSRSAADRLGEDDRQDESSNDMNNGFGHALRFCVGPNSASIFS